MARNLSLTIIVISSFTLFAGCVVGPDFQRPKVPFQLGNFASTEDQQLQLDVNGTPVSEGMHDVHTWWAELGDPILTELLTHACRNNPGAMEAWSRVSEARSLREATLATAWPQITSDINYARQRFAPGSSGQVGLRSGDPFDAFTHNFRATWEIDLFGRIQRSVEASNARTHVAQENYRDVITSLLADLATNYVDLRVLQSRLAISRENLDVQSKNLELADTRNKAGLVGLLDVKQAETVVQTTRSQVPVLEEQIRVRLHRISTLLGQPPTQQFFSYIGQGPVPMPRIGIATGIPAQLVSQRPDVRLAEQELRAAVADIGVATADLYPQVSLLGNPSFDSSVFRQLYTGQSFGFSAGPSISWNVFSFGRIKNTIAAREAAADQAEFRFRTAVLRAVEEVETGLIGYRKSQERAELLSKAAEAAAEAVGLSESTYQIGRSTFQRVVDAQRQLLQSQEQLATARGDIVLSWIQTYRALGGGWRSSPCQTVGQGPRAAALRSVPQGYGPPPLVDLIPSAKSGSVPDNPDDEEDLDDEDSDEEDSEYESDEEDTSEAMTKRGLRGIRRNRFNRSLETLPNRPTTPYPTAKNNADTRSSNASPVPWGRPSVTPPGVIFTEPQPSAVSGRTQPWDMGGKPRTARRSAGQPRVEPKLSVPPPPQAVGSEQIGPQAALPSRQPASPRVATSPWVQVD